MTKAQAQKALEGPLRFGDEMQIHAHEWLKLFAEINGSEAECGDFELSEHRDYSLKQLRELAKEVEEAAA